VAAFAVLSSTKSDWWRVWPVRGHCAEIEIYFSIRAFSKTWLLELEENAYPDLMETTGWRRGWPVRAQVVKDILIGLN